MTVLPDRLAQLDTITLHEGSHRDFQQGHCAMEVVSWLADEGFTDAPACASPVLARYVIRLNDRWGDEKRQALKPYLVRMIGTGGDGKDSAREEIATRFLADRLLTPWLQLAGMHDQVTALQALAGSDTAGCRRLLCEISDAAWKLRTQRRDELATKIGAELEKRMPAAAAAAAVADAVAAAAADAVAVADAAADAVADAAADAAADADAVAVAVAVAAAAAVAVAVAVAVADAAAAAAAVAVAVADAVPVAVADAVADAVAAAAADAAAVEKGESTWSAAYWAARRYYEANPLPVSQQIADLAATQDGAALELLDLIIAADVTA